MWKYTSVWNIQGLQFRLTQKRTVLKPGNFMACLWPYLNIKVSRGNGYLNTCTNSEHGFYHLSYYKFHIFSSICQVNAPGNVRKQIHTEHLRPVLLLEYKTNKSHISKWFNPFLFSRTYLFVYRKPWVRSYCIYIVHLKYNVKKLW